MARIRAWLVAAWAWTKHAVTPSPLAWRAAMYAMLVVWVGILLALTFNDIVPDYSTEKLIGGLVIVVALALISGGLLLVIWFFKSLKLGYRVALFLALPSLMLLLLAVWAEGMFIAVPLLFLGVSLFVGAGVQLIAGRSWYTGAWFALGAALLGLAAYGLLAPPPDLNPTLDHYHLKDKTLALADPGLPGAYRVTQFTYGSGHDLHRPEYAQGVRFKTRPVDGSKLDVEWTGFGGWLRTRYWGFDAKHMPLQGRVWMPVGDGPFPLVLIVHGNHQMEEFSDPGYAYLGALMASRGFIFVSVDENFINSSVSDQADFFHFRMGDENKARAWLLLEHLAQWRRWTNDANSPLHGRIDMDRIALIGHSRGGEAVATANAFNKLAYFPDDATVKFDFRFHLRGIAAIAPADGQYKPREWPTPMRNQNYFVLHGSLDGDVVSFMGSAQYSRATYSRDADAFKASIYIKDANHGQFNTSWGRNDLGLPIRFLLDERPIMDANAQRRIAKAYLSAFLEATLHDKREYRPLFQDARNGARWLPDHFILNNYADGATTWLATYEEDIDPATGTYDGLTISAPNLTAWKEKYPELKWNRLGSELALLAWDSRVHKTGASYRLQFRQAATPPMDSAFVFSASQADMPTLPKDFKGKADGDDKDAALDWSIVVTDQDGRSARLPLSHDQVLYPQLKGETRRIGALDKNPRSEIVMRRFAFALADFEKANPALDVMHIREIRFDFDRSKRGAIALDDVGFAPLGSSPVQPQ